MLNRDVIVKSFILWVYSVTGVFSSRPHIIIILADDLGWNDVSFHGSNQIPTPNIDALAYNGVILNSHYVPALCTPSRASLLTGKYPTTIGMQHLVILANEPWGLPLEETLMPQYFKRRGYSTHAIGKWHLGFHHKEYTPTYRGFDTHFGYWNGYQDYYDHTMDHMDGMESYKGYDMRRNMDVDYSSQGKYSTDLFTEEAVKIIKNHNSTDTPLFLYLAHLAPHSGNPDKPFQAPDDLIAKHSYIKDPERRVYAAMVSRMDESVGEVVSALRDSDMLENSIILFLSDNGAVTFGVHSNHGSNFPLRGLKESPWEGGVRGVAAIWSPLLNRTQRVSNQLLHASDWLPTLYSAAGFDTSDLGKIDGKDVWNSLSHDFESPRTEVFNNYDEIENYSSVRVGPWKYITGTAQNGEVDDWYGDSGEETLVPYSIPDVLNSKTNVAVNGYLTDKQLENYGKDHEIPDVITEEIVNELRKNSVVKCDYSAFSVAANEIETRNLSTENFKNNYKMLGDSERFNGSGDIFSCDPLKTICLFNLEKDPCERVNLAKFLPDVVEVLEIRLRELKKTVAKPLNTPGDFFSNPSFHNSTWTSWRDVDRENYFIIFDEILFLILDNVLVKIVFSPLLLLVNEMEQIFIQLLRSFLSLLSVIVFSVVTMLVLNGIRKIILINQLEGEEKVEVVKNSNRKSSIFEDNTASQLGFAKAYCSETIR